MNSDSGITRVYRTTWSQRAFSIVFIVFGVFFLIGFLYAAVFGQREASLFWLLIPVGFLALGSLLAAQAFKSYLALCPTEICTQSISERKTLPFDKIRGRRKYMYRSGSVYSYDVWHFTIVPNDDRFPLLDFEERYYKLDEAFRSWFNTLPDLDALDKTGPKRSDFGLV